MFLCPIRELQIIFTNTEFVTYRCFEFVTNRLSLFLIHLVVCWFANKLIIMVQYLRMSSLTSVHSLHVYNLLYLKSDFKFSRGYWHIKRFHELINETVCMSWAFPVPTWCNEWDKCNDHQTMTETICLSVEQQHQPYCHTVEDQCDRNL